MSGESEIEKKEKGFVGHFFSWVAGVFFVLAIYVLSVGPVFYLMGREYLPGKLEAVYAPIEIIANYSPTVEKLFDWYLVKCGCVKLVIQDDTPLDRPKDLK